MSVNEHEQKVIMADAPPPHISYLEFNYMRFLLVKVLHSLGMLFSGQVTSDPSLKLDDEGFIGQPQLFPVEFCSHRVYYILTESRV